MKVLVIDDNVEMGSFLQSHLPARGFAVDLVTTGKEGISYARTNEYDLILLDLNLPDVSGETVMAALQAQNDIPPVLMLTVIADAASKVRVLNAGADDYLVKPFVFDELVARMRALLRRSERLVPEVITIGDMVLNMGTQTVRRGMKDITLTRKEFALLTYLVRNQGVVVPKSTLIEHVWDSSSNAFSASVETHMTNLRHKLGSPQLIQTIHSRGYIIG